jgi:chorismate--pyruvate lyase
LKPEPLDRRLRAWLHSSGSLSRRIAAAFAGFEVQRTRQRSGPARPDEARLLGTRRVHLREVVLWAEGRPLVVARSVLPAVQSRLAWRAVRGLGTRPLADLLFGERAVHRRTLGLVHCPRAGAGVLRRQLAGTAAAADWAGRGAWGRRAVFTHFGVPLLLTEWFSPALAERKPGPREAGRVRGRPGARGQNRRA